MEFWEFEKKNNRLLQCLNSSRFITSLSILSKKNVGRLSLVPNETFKMKGNSQYILKRFG